MISNKDFYRGKRVFITGHTGFKGAWLTAMLHYLGAESVGYALEAPEGSLFKNIKGETLLGSVISDIRQREKLQETICDFKPEIIIHLAAMAIVGDCYKEPWEAYSTNVMGTVNLFEAIRKCDTVGAVLIVTTDKVYENLGDARRYIETDKLGCDDTYACSKTCMELIAETYKKTYFMDGDKLKLGVSTVRASNVIAGGDHIKTRLIPSILESFATGTKVELRHPKQTRPWQYVLDALNGYLTIAKRMYLDPNEFSSQWNIGPYTEGIKDVEWITKTMCEFYGEGAAYFANEQNGFRESATLGLEIEKALKYLDWTPKKTTEELLYDVVEFFKDQKNGIPEYDICMKQIARFFEETGGNKCDSF